MIIKQFIFGMLAILWAYNVAAIDVGKSIKISPDLKPLHNMLALPEERIDLAETRLHIEKFLVPSIDITMNLKEIERIVVRIKKVPRYSETTEGKLNGIIQYLYLAGDWNGNKPYHYDFDDPLGTTKQENSFISHYLETRLGNCVSMPMLVLILGKRLGLDISLSIAPRHFFVRLKDEGHFYNFEATAGGLKADSSYVKELMITPQALKNGIYLQSLTKKQTVAVMLTELAIHYSKGMLNSDFNKAFELTGLMLKHDPKSIKAMLIRGNTWSNILRRDLKTFEAKRMQMTPPIKKHFDTVLALNLKWFEKAEALGWREPPQDFDERFLKMVNKARKYYE